MSAYRALREPEKDGDAAGSVTGSVTRALLLLEAFRSSSGPMGVSRLSRVVGLPKSTTFRILSHLESAGFIERVDKEYQLANRLFELGNSVPMCDAGGLREAALPYLAELHAATGCVVQLAILDGSDVIYLDKIVGRTTVPVPTRIGGRMPAACTALGKAMLAFSSRSHLAAVVNGGLQRRTRYSIADPQRFLAELQRINGSRVAFDREEVRLGLSCVAAPILSEGAPVAAVSLASDATPNFLPTVVVKIQRAAEAISDRLSEDR